MKHTARRVMKDLPGNMNQLTAQLLIRDGYQTRTVLINSLPFTIGRQPERSLFLPTPEVSREHAVIVRDAEGFLIKDLGSRFGTLVNGEKKEHTRLKSGDRIQLGSIELLFEVSEDQVSPTTAVNML